jgi:hypothetical protein
VADLANLESQTYANLAASVSAMAAYLGLPVAEVNVDFTPPRDAKSNRLPYLSVSYQPNGAQRDSLGFAEPDELDDDATMEGLLQVSVYWPARVGLVKPSLVAGQVASWFRPGTRLDGGGFSVYVDRRPDVTSAMQESDVVQIPVTVRWRATRTPA